MANHPTLCTQGRQPTIYFSKYGKEYLQALPLKPRVLVDAKGRMLKYKVREACRALVPLCACVRGHVLCAHLCVYLRVCMRAQAHGWGCRCRRCSAGCWRMLKAACSTHMHTCVRIFTRAHIHILAHTHTHALLRAWLVARRRRLCAWTPQSPSSAWTRTPASCSCWCCTWMACCVATSQQAARSA